MCASLRTISKKFFQSNLNIILLLCYFWCRQLRLPPSNCEFEILQVASLPTTMTSSPFLSFHPPLKEITSLHLDNFHWVQLHLSSFASWFRPHWVTLTSCGVHLWTLKNALSSRWGQPPEMGFSTTLIPRRYASISLPDMISSAFSPIISTYSHFHCIYID